MNYMDDGVLVEILARLPAKSLSRFKCVDRRWNSLISDPRLVRAQARRLTSQRLVLKGRRGRVSVDLEGLMNGRWEAMRLDLDIVGSCHGLMCIVNDSGRFVLYNPAIVTSRALPIQPFELEARFPRGLGYDALNDDYKLVIGNRDTDHQGRWEFHVFSLRYNSWRRAGRVDAVFADFEGKYSDGFLHWPCILGEFVHQQGGKTE